MLLETHQSFSAPESCRHDGSSHAYLGTVWFDDPDLVRQAASLGMPAVLGTFSLNITNNQDIEVWTWTWRVDGGEPSSLTFSDSPPSLPVTFSAPSRYFWFNENMVNYYDNTFLESYDQAGNPTAVGTMAEPMMYAQGDDPAFAGTATLAKAASFDGTIHRFTDLECKNEIPPSEW